MLHFPTLTALVEKNSGYRGYFKVFTNWQNGHNTIRTKCSENTDQQHQPDQYNGKSGTGYKKVPIIGGFTAKTENLIHWKKKVKAKFEYETSVTVHELSNAKEEGLSFAGSVFDAMGNADEASKECKICDKAFGSRRLLNQHKTFAHFSQSASNEFCYLPYFIEPGQFDAKKHGKGTLECVLCQKWFSGVNEDVDSYLEERKTKLRRKEDCKKRGRKGKTTTRRICELCSKILSNRKGLERHMLIHTGEKPFPCDICQKPFRRKDNCVRHKKTAHLFKKPRKPRRRRLNNSSAILKNEKRDDAVNTK